MIAGNLKSLKCEGCGAALGAEDIQGSLVVCRFCGQSHTHEHSPAAMAPWHLPIPPPPRLPMGMMPAPKRSGAGVIVGVALAIIVVGGVVSAVASSAARPSRASSQQAGSDAHTPDATYAQGEAVRVLWKGVWYDGHIKELRGSQYVIGYDGWSTSWDEEVDLTRLQKKRD